MLHCCRCKRRVINGHDNNSKGIDAHVRASVQKHWRRTPEREWLYHPAWLHRADLLAAVLEIVSARELSCPLPLIQVSKDPRGLQDRKALQVNMDHKEYRGWKVIRRYWTTGACRQRYDASQCQWRNIRHSVGHEPFHCNSFYPISSKDDDDFSHERRKHSSGLWRIFYRTRLCWKSLCNTRTKLPYLYYDLQDWQWKRKPTLPNLPANRVCSCAKPTPCQFAL